MVETIAERKTGEHIDSGIGTDDFALSDLSAPFGQHFQLALDCFRRVYSYYIYNIL